MTANRCSLYRVGGLAVLTALFLTLASPAAFAHGGVSIQQDRCVLSIGPYRMHFSGYVEGKEFCEDIPKVGATSIVMDYVDQALTPMQAEVIVKRHPGAWGSGPEGDGETILRKPPQQYPQGTIQVKHEFQKAGNYVGIVTIRGEDGTKYVSRFPFSVGGRIAWMSWIGTFLIAVVVLGGIALYLSDGEPIKSWLRKRRGEPEAASQPTRSASSSWWPWS